MGLIRKLALIGIGLVGLARLVQAQEYDWRNVELLSPDIAEARYGHVLPPDIYTRLEDIFDNTGALKVRVEGKFDSTSILHKQQGAIILEGVTPEKSQINALIASSVYMEIANIQSEGTTVNIGEPFTAFAGFLGGGLLQDCYLTRNACVAINPSYDFTMRGNVFDGVRHPEYQSAISFEHASTANGILSISYNEFRNMPNVFYMFHSAYCGVRSEGGNNTIIDCQTVIINPYDYPQDFTGNLWADSGKSSGNLVIYTNPTEILQKKVSEVGRGNVDVTNPLTSYNDDYDMDNLPNRIEVLKGTDQTNPDSDFDGVNDGTEVQFGANPLDPTDTPHVPLGYLGVGIGLGLLGTYASRHIKSDNG